MVRTEDKKSITKNLVKQTVARLHAPLAWACLGALSTSFAQDPQLPLIEKGSALVVPSPPVASPGVFPNSNPVESRPPVIPAANPIPLGTTAGSNGLAGTSKVLDIVNPISTLDATVELAVGQSRTLTLKKPISEGKAVGVVAVGDPTIADFEILPNPRMLRLSAKRAGVTDLTIILGDDSVLTLQVFVKYDLELLNAEIQHRFPDTAIKISQLRENIVLEGQVRTAAMASQIVGIAEAWLGRPSASSKGASAGSVGRTGDQIQSIQDRAAGEPGSVPADTSQEMAGIEVGARGAVQSQTPSGSVINLLRVPGTQQIMLQVRVAELNKTGMREIGADWIFGSSNGNVVGTNISGNSVTAKGTMGVVSDTGSANGGLISAGTGNSLGSNGTAFGIFPSANFDVLLRILRNSKSCLVKSQIVLIPILG